MFRKQLGEHVTAANRAKDLFFRKKWFATRTIRDSEMASTFHQLKLFFSQYSVVLRPTGRHQVNPFESPKDDPPPIFSLTAGG